MLNHYDKLKVSSNSRSLIKNVLPGIKNNKSVIFLSYPVKLPRNSPLKLYPKTINCIRYVYMVYTM